MMNSHAGISALLRQGVRDGVYPGAVLLAARAGEIIFLEAAGRRSLVPPAGPVRMDTIFDLASLTKPLAATPAVMKLVDMGRLGLDRPLGDLLDVPVPEEKREITLRRLLNHSAGFTDWHPFYRELEDVPLPERKAVLRRRLLDFPLDYRPGERCVYSDLGFMLLEWIIEACAGMPLDRFIEKEFYGPLLLKDTFLGKDHLPEGMVPERFAATEKCPWRGETVLGYTHDENAWSFGGYSGHAGLFGTAGEVYALAELLRTHYHGERTDHLRPETVRAFFTREGPGRNGHRALGWDTPAREGSSAGRYFSGNSVGHLGFTGCSLWMDLDKNVIVIFLTNRIHPTRENEKIRAFRPVVHDRVMTELGFG